MPPRTNRLPGSCLFNDQQGWSLSRLPEPYASMPKSASSDLSELNQSSGGLNPQAKLHGYTIEALLEYVKDEKSEIGVVKIADGSYASQRLIGTGLAGDSYLIAHLGGNGVLSASIYNPTTKQTDKLPSLGTQSQVFNSASILLLFILARADQNRGKLGNCITHELLQETHEEFQTTGAISERRLRLICDDLYWAISYGELPTGINTGAINPLKSKRIDSGEFSSAKLLVGKPDILQPSSTAGSATVSAAANTVGAAKALVKPYTDTLQWSAEEELLIPQFDDATEVPPEVMTICKRFVESRSWKNPLNNPCWRGITAYGKSTGVKILASILHTPLVWMTCSSTSEVEDFLSKIVPDCDSSSIADGNLPSYEDIVNDPVYAYQLLTGEEKDDVTGEEVLNAYVKACAAGDQNAKRNPFKVVESDFVTALVKGYIVEVQEFSRIRDAGVLVGLNNYNEPNAVIPLVDGRHVRRHPNALVVWTDNVGLASCRKVDASVLRRMSFIIDSYDMPQDRAMRRILANTGCTDEPLVERMYNVWRAIGNYCKINDITDEGTASLTELENWVALTLLDGDEEIKNTCREAVVSKLSSDPETQDQIMDACVILELRQAGFAV